MNYKDIIKKIMQSVLTPDFYINFLIWKRGAFEPEIELLPLICDNESLSIDVGAADGIYTIHLYRLSKLCYAFEPRRDAFERLGQIFRNTKKDIKLEPYALSNVEGIAELKIFPDEYGRSTIEKENHLEKDGKVEYIKVNIKTLDAYNFKNRVGFIKIDVEGHEEAVLRGASNLISRDHPSFLIEIEDRHKHDAIESVSKYLKLYGYQGYFYKNGELYSMNEFNKDIHQNPINISNGHNYFNNFLFVIDDIIPRLRNKTAK